MLSLRCLEFDICKYGGPHKRAGEQREVADPRGQDRLRPVPQKHRQRDRHQVELDPRAVRREHRLSHHLLHPVPPHHHAAPQDLGKLRGLQQEHREEPEAQRLRLAADREVREELGGHEGH